MNYVKPGDKILDTHVGSASSLVTCYERGFELDKNMYNLASNRLEEVINQISMFNVV
ncbi:hypothetical protein [Clostridium chromiireducens]|uniref:hypothetical protein n=1 Tax=Clostridium chromiireducens TaxID=225345 RepID=UPI001923146B|nr:hypothetical protein [Clostridium chromiireducens]